MHYSTNQKNTDQQEDMLKNKSVTEVKVNIKKEILEIYILRNLIETVNPTMHMITNIYTQ